MTRVEFIPRQTDDEDALTSSRVSSRSPLRLLFRDIRVLIQNLPYAVNTVLPRKPAVQLPGVTYNPRIETRDSVLSVIIVIIEVLMFILFFPCVILLPGWATALFYGIAYALFWIFGRWMWGSLVVSSKVSIDKEKLEDFRREKWFFVNGIATSHNSIQTSCDCLAATFGRPVTGIHNRSYGIVGDILECLVQRCFGYNTEDVRVAYENIKIHVIDPEVTKVVVIAHSQGGILASLVLDRLFAEVPGAAISKMEIYTFGSAAAHFNNPPLEPSPAISAASPTYRRKVPALNPSTPTSPIKKTNNCIDVIEHYCNELDMVPRWGVLYNTQQEPGEKYAGRVFIHKAASGHLFNQHYLETMFPLDAKRFDHFLDQVVDVDHDTAIKRAETINFDAEPGTAAPRGSPLYLVPPTSNSITKKKTWKIRTKDELDAAMMEGSGKTVRQLSKLWKYVGGKDGDAVVDEIRSPLPGQLSVGMTPLVEHIRRDVPVLAPTPPMPSH